MRIILCILIAAVLLPCAGASAESGAEVIEPIENPRETPAAQPAPPQAQPQPLPPLQAPRIDPAPDTAETQPPLIPPSAPRNTGAVSRLPVEINEPDFKMTVTYPEKPLPKFNEDIRAPKEKEIPRPKVREFSVPEEEGVANSGVHGDDGADTKAAETEELSPALARALEKSHGKKTEELVAALKEVTAAEEQNAEAHYRLGLLLARTGDIAHALEELGQALKLKPNSNKYKCDFALVALHAGWIERALEACRAAATGEPANARYQSALGDVYMAANNVSEAAEVYLRAIKLDARNPEYYHNLGKAYLYANAYKRAGDVLDEAIKLRPGCSMYYCTRGLAYQSDKQIKEAIGCYMLAVKSDKKNAYAHYLLAGCFSDAEDPTFTDRFQAKDHAEEAVKLTNRKNPQYLMGLARVMRVSQNYEQAITIGQMAIAIEPREDWRKEIAEFERLRTEGGRK